MKTYVLGAGASYPVYPLSSQLMQCMHEFWVSLGKTLKLDSDKAWIAFMKWLERTSDPLLREAYRMRDIEQILTILDLASRQQLDRVMTLGKQIREGLEALHEREGGLTTKPLTKNPEPFGFLYTTATIGGEQNGAVDNPVPVQKVIATTKKGKALLARARRAARNLEKLHSDIDKYQENKKFLLRVLGLYLRTHHFRDEREFHGLNWGFLKKFASRLNPGDTVVTFNYDSTIERVLLAEGKWSPKNGYGMEIEFQVGEDDPTPFQFSDSAVTVLHLHGASGWYKCAEVRRADSVSLSPLLIQCFGLSARDVTMPSGTPEELPMLLYPTYLKDYGADTHEEPLRKLWKLAATALQNSEQTVIIGYSLPQSDAAAWMLLLTNCEGKRTKIVNPDKGATFRYACLLGCEQQETMGFGTWLEQ